MDKNQINNFELGLNKDIHDKAYKPGHYTFALNAVNETSDGDLFAISSEIGNQECFSISNTQEVELLPNPYMTGNPISNWEIVYGHTTQSAEYIFDNALYLFGIQQKNLSGEVTTYKVKWDFTLTNIVYAGTPGTYITDLGLRLRNNGANADYFNLINIGPNDDGTDTLSYAGELEITTTEVFDEARFFLNMGNVATYTITTNLFSISKINTTELIPIGHVQLENAHIIFSTSTDNQSEIGIVEDCVYTTLVNDDCLNFSNQIQATWRILNGCDRVIYWVDGSNPDRVFNIDSWLRDPNDNDATDENGNFDCSLIKLKPDIDIGCVTNVDILNTGGQLKHGVYQIILSYTDSNGNESHMFYHSPQIPITQGSYGTNYKAITGGDPLTYPPTSKAIRVDMSDLDLRYDYVNINVAYTGTSTTEYYFLDQVPIVASTANYFVTTLETNQSTLLDKASLVIVTNPYETSSTITQHDNRLIKGNLKTKAVDYAAFQVKANNIQVTYSIDAKRHPDSKDSSGLAKSSTYYFDNRSYMRDEIYSLGIVWIFKDGTESPVFHIPGRAANVRANGNPLPTTSQSDPNPWHPRTSLIDTPLLETGWDTGYIAAAAGPIILDDFTHLSDQLFEDPSTGPLVKYIERWKCTNTAVSNNAENSLTSTGELAFWESEYRYPVIEKCDEPGVYIYPVENNGGVIEGQKIRHHKMPDTALELHFGISGSSKYIRPLGLTLDNIAPPTAYVDDVQGYYIVREKRDDVNKTVLDKGLLFVNAYARVVPACGDTDEIVEYAFQTNLFNVHDFRDKLSTFNSVDVKVRWGLLPMYSSIDKKCGDIGFRTDTDQYVLTTDANTNLDIVRRFLLYDDTSQCFHAPRHKFNGDVYNATYIKAEKELYSVVTEEQRNGSNCGRDKATLRLVSTEWTGFRKPGFSNRKLDDQGPISIEPDEEIPQGILNRHFLNNNQQSALIMEFDRPVGNVTDQYENNNSYSDGYREGDNCTTQYVSAKRDSYSIYGQVGGGVYYRASNCMHDSTETSVTVFGGDIFISEFSFFKSSMNEFCTGADCAYIRFLIDCKHDTKNDASQVASHCKSLSTFFVESEVNTELRHIDYNNLGSFSNTFWPFFDGSKLEFLQNVEVREHPGLDGEQDNDGYCTGFFGYFKPGCKTYTKNLYLYNTAYSKERDLKSFIPLGKQFQFCHPCINNYPRRITYSESSQQSEREDDYRIFLPLSFRDIPPNTGEITNLFVNYDKLYCHTPRSIYQIFTKDQQLKSDQATLYIGTGEFLSIPPAELVNTSYGYAGSRQQWSTITTEFGTVYIDDLTGRIFLLSDKLNEISSAGLRNWFEAEIPLKFLEQSPDHPIQPSLPTGIGYLSSYDPRHKRIIITKKDYKWRGSIPFSDTFDFSDQNKYEDHGWTISYSFLTNSWTSWHSYRPSFYFNDANTFYSFNNGKFWEHNKGEHQVYYEEDKRNFIAEFPIFNPSLSQSLSSLQWVSDAKIYDTTNKKYRYDKNITFDQGYVYNEDQATYPFSIIPKPNDYYNIGFQADEIVAVRTDNTWKISGLRDWSTNDTETVLTSEWADNNFLTAFNADNYIDHIINPDLVDNTKTQYQLADLKSRVNYVRLFFKPEENYKQILLLVNSANDQYVR